MRKWISNFIQEICWKIEVIGHIIVKNLYFLIINYNRKYHVPSFLFYPAVECSQNN